MLRCVPMEKLSLSQYTINEQSNEYNTYRTRLQTNQGHCCKIPEPRMAITTFREFSRILSAVVNDNSIENFDIRSASIHLFWRRIEPSDYTGRPIPEMKQTILCQRHQ